MKKPVRHARIDRRRRNNIKAALKKARRPDGCRHYFKPFDQLKRGGAYARAAKKIDRAHVGALFCRCGTARINVDPAIHTKMFQLMGCAE